MPTTKPTKQRDATKPAPTGPKPPRRKNDTAMPSAPERTKLTKAKLDKLLLSRPHRQYTIWDTETTGLSVLVSRGPTHDHRATVTFRVVYYLKPGEPRYLKIGRYPDKHSDIEAVRREAQQARIDAKNGIDPTRPKLSGNFKEIVEGVKNKEGVLEGGFLANYAKGKVSEEETKRILTVYVVPEWADKNVESITKSDVSALVNKIANRRITGPKGRKIGTPSVARSVRTQLVTLFNWYVANHSSEDFRSPIVKPPKNDKVLKKPKARERCLSDDEIRVLWTASGDLGIYGAAIRFALLSAQRFGKIKEMRRRDLKDRMRIQGRMENGRWIDDQDIGHVWDPSRPNDPENKKVSPVPLSKLARDVIATLPIIDAQGGKDFVFTTTGRGPLDNWDRYKKQLDRKITAALREGDRNAALEPWQHRDLRRTARTLLSRAGVRSDVSEHCLGHVRPEIEGTYDRYDYLAEKADAFERLAQLIGRIVNPADNVVPLRPAAPVAAP
jgi:hypothetical protein